MSQKEINKIFENAGFSLEYPEEDLKKAIKLTKKISRPHDIIANWNNIKILIDYKEYPKDEKPKYSELIHDQKILMTIAKASAGILIFKDKKISDDYKKYGAKNRIFLWDEYNIKYYKILSETIKEYAKYEIIHSLGLSVDEEKNLHSVLALRYKQPNKKSNFKIYCFSCHPDNLLKSAIVFRKASLQNKKYYQRIIKKKRLLSIGKFININKKILPNSIIVLLGEKVIEKRIDINKKIHLSNKETDLVSLFIPLEYSSIEVIDGQHRLFGFIHASENKKRDFNLSVIGIKGLKEKDKKNLFVDINDNAKGVDPNLVSHLLYTENESECKKNPRLMAIKIAINLNKEGPFKDKIRILDIGEEEITLKGLSGYDLKNMIGKRGAFRKIFPQNNSKKYIVKLKQYFNIIKNEYELIWDDSKNYMLATNRGISALLKVLKRILIKNNKWSKGEMEKVIKALKKSKFDWSREKLKNKYVGAAGWKKFYEDIIEAISKNYKNL